MNEDVSQIHNTMDPKLVIDEDLSTRDATPVGAEEPRKQFHTDEPNNKDKNMTPDEIALTNLENKLKEFHTIASTTKRDSPLLDKPFTICDNAEEKNAAPAIFKTAPKPLTPCEEKQVALAWNAAGVHRCPVCKFSTDDMSIFDNHRTSCTPPRLPADAQGPVLLSYTDSVYKCTTCMITWKNRAEFEEHIVCHLLSDPYLCITCMKTFKSRIAIEQHAKQVHIRGESRCGLKGMKKGRKIVKNLEEKGSYEFPGRLTIPKTPRNQIKVGEPSACLATTSSCSTDVPAAENAKIEQNLKTNTSNEAVTVVIPKALPKKLAIQSNVGTDQTDVPNISCGVSNPSVTVTESTSTAFATASGQSKPSGMALAVPADVTNSTTVEKNQPKQAENKSAADKKVSAPKEKPPQYHVKHFTEYTKEQTCVSQSAIAQVVSGQTPQMLILPVGGPRPVGPILHVDPVTKLLVPVQFHPAPADQINLAVQTVQSMVTPTVSSVIAQTQKTVVTLPDIQNTIALSSSQSVEQSKFQYIAPKLQAYPRPQVTPVALPNGQLLLPQGQTVCKPSLMQSVQITTPNVHSTVTLQTIPPIPESNALLPVQQPCVATTVSLVSKPSPSAQNSGFRSILSTQPSQLAPATTPTSAPVIQWQQNTSVAATQQTNIDQFSMGPNKQQNGRPNTKTAEKNDISFFKERFNIASASTTVSTVQNDHVTMQTATSRPDPPTYNEAVKVMAEKGTDGHTATVNVPTETSNPKKFLFRIKPGQGFVCEACRKFTKDEIVFRRHVWDHFHQEPLACKTCNAGKIINKDFLGCLLVNDVVKSLIKMSNVIDADVISISDDEGEKEQINLQDGKHSVQSNQQSGTTDKKKTNGTEVIVLEDDDSVNNSNNLKIKIASTYSLFHTMSNESGALKQTSTFDDDKQKQSVVSHVQLKEANEKDQPDKASDIEPAFGKTCTVTTAVTPSEKNIPAIINDMNSKPTNKTLVDGKANVISKDTKKRLADFIATAERKERKEPLTEQKEKVENRENNMEVPFSNPLEDNIITVLSNKVQLATTLATTAKADFNSPERIIFESEVLKRQRHAAFYICGMENCGYACLISQKFREHLNSKHVGAYAFVCCHCGAKDYTEDAHVRHMYSHANAKVFLLYTCPVRLCKYKTNLVHMYGEHLKCHKSEDLNIKCVFCHQVFTDINSLVSHLKDNLLKFINCPHCSFKFVNKAVVMKHIQLSHPDKPRMVGVTSQIVCLEREINFYSPPAVGRSECTPITEQDIPDATKIDIPAMLDRVDKETIQPTELLLLEKDTKKPTTIKAPSYNINKIDKELSVQLDRSSVMSWKDRDVVNLKCPHCSYLCYNQRYFKEHIARHTDGEEPDRLKRFICIYCSKSTNDVNAFKTHMSNHIGTHDLKIFSCTLCAYQSNQKYNIMDHIQDGHPEKGQYIQVINKVKSNEVTCRYCNFKSRHAEHVSQHSRSCSFQNVKGLSTPTPLASKDQHTSKPLCDKTSTAPLASKTKSVQQPGQSEGEKTRVNNEPESKKLRKYHCHYCSDYFKHKSDLRSHLESDHLDTDNKHFSTFKCKYCHYTSTMKDVIVTHMNKKHEGQEVRILRRIETVESTTNLSNPKASTDHVRTGETVKKNEDSSEKMDDIESGKRTGKEEIVIPDGNIFSQPFKCTKCSFTHKIRLAVMRHIKEHPELFPVREITKSHVSKKSTARKSTSGLQEQTNFNISHQNALQQKSKCAENPFTAVKKIVSSLDMAEAEADKQKSKNQYVLGGDELHGRLSACFLPLEKELGFRCRICRQKIAKTFVLHRHVLDHLNIVFYKCCYCEQGSIEQTLLLGHIHNEHPLKPVKFNSIEKTEINTQLRDKIASQNFNDTLNLLEQTDRPDVDYAEKTGLVKRSVHEPAAKSIEKTSEDTPSIYKCHLCKYTVKKAYFLNLHLKGHDDPRKIFSCSICGFRSAYRGDVAKHIRKLHITSGTVINDSKKDKTKTDDVDREDNEKYRDQRSSSVDSKSSKRSISSSQGDKPEDAYKPKKSKTDTGKPSSKFLYEMRQIFKCIDCGEKRYSKGALYDHFKSSKCSRIWYQCVYCTFKCPTKTDIRSHCRIRHAGKKFDLKPLPMSAKIKELKIPIRYSVKVSDKTSDDANGETSKQSTVNTEVYKCLVCNKYTCESVMKLQFHFNTKHEGKQVQCQQCNYRTPLIKHMLNHCKNLHMQETAKYSLVSDQTKTKSLSKIADGKTATPTLISSEDEDDTIGYRCVKCEYVGHIPSILKLHMKRHLNYSPYCCKYCEMRFKHLKYIKSHIEKLHASKVMKYSVQKDDAMEARLEKMLEQARKRRERELKATNKDAGINEKKRAMSESDTESPMKKARKVHLSPKDDAGRSSSEKEVGSNKYRVAMDWAGRRMFQCIHCDYKSNKKFNLQVHIGKKHGRDGNNGFKCWYCDFTSSFLCNAYRHVRMLHPGRAMRAINNKTSQILSPKKTDFPSPVKSKKIAYAGDNKTSPTPKPAVRQIFPKSSEIVRVSSATLTRETASKLTYTCNICDVKIKELYSFCQHLTSHDGFKYVIKQKNSESRLACGYCYYVAKDNNDFSEHIASHLEERRYKCGYCDYTSFTTSVLAKHHHSRHPDEPSKVVDTHQTQVKGFVLLVDISPVVKIQRCDDSKIKVATNVDETKETNEENADIGSSGTNKPDSISQNQDADDYSTTIPNIKKEELQACQSDIDMAMNDKEELNIYTDGKNYSETVFSVKNDSAENDKPFSDDKVIEYSETADEQMNEENDDHANMEVNDHSKQAQQSEGCSNSDSGNLIGNIDKQHKPTTDEEIDEKNKEGGLHEDANNLEGDNYDDKQLEKVNQLEQATHVHADKDNAGMPKMQSDSSKQNEVAEKQVTDGNTDEEYKVDVKCDDSKHGHVAEVHVDSTKTICNTVADAEDGVYESEENTHKQVTSVSNEEQMICSDVDKDVWKEQAPVTKDDCFVEKQSNTDGDDCNIDRNSDIAEVCTTSKIEVYTTAKMTAQSNVEVSNATLAEQPSKVSMKGSNHSYNEADLETIVSVNNSEKSLPVEKKTQLSTEDQLTCDTTDSAIVKVSNIEDNSSKINSGTQEINSEDSLKKENNCDTDLAMDEPMDVGECNSTSGSHKEWNTFKDEHKPLPPKTESDQHEDIDSETNQEVSDKSRTLCEDLEVVSNLSELTDETSRINESHADRNVFKDVCSDSVTFVTPESNSCDNVQHSDAMDSSSSGEDNATVKSQYETDTDKLNDRLVHAENDVPVHVSGIERNIFKDIINKDSTVIDSNTVEQPKDAVESGRNIFNDIDTVTVTSDCQADGSTSDVNSATHVQREDKVVKNTEDTGSRHECVTVVDTLKVDQDTADLQDGVNKNCSMSVEDIISDINSSLQLSSSDHDLPTSCDPDLNTQSFVSSSQPFDAENSDTNVNADES